MNVCTGADNHYIVYRLDISDRNSLNKTVSYVIT